MGIFSKLFAIIRKIFKKIIEFVKKALKKLWPLLLLVAAVYFAPAIGSWLATNGMTSLGAAFTAIGSTITPYLTSGLSMLWSGVSAAGTWAGSAFSALSLGQKAAVLLGGAALIAPEETAAFTEAVVVEAVDVASSVVGAAASGFASSPIGMLAIGLTLWFLLSRDRDPTSQGG